MRSILVPLALLLAPSEAFFGFKSRTPSVSTLDSTTSSFNDDFFESCDVFLDESGDDDYDDDDDGNRRNTKFSSDNMEMGKFYCFRVKDQYSYKFRFQNHLLMEVDSQKQTSKFTVEIMERDNGGFALQKTSTFLSNESPEIKLSDHDDDDDEDATTFRVKFDQTVHDDLLQHSLNDASLIEEHNGTKYVPVPPMHGLAFKAEIEINSALKKDDAKLEPLASYKHFTCYPKGKHIKCSVKGSNDMNGYVILHLHAKKGGKVTEKGIANVNASSNAVIINMEKVISLHEKSKNTLAPVVCGANGVCFKLSIYEMIVEYEMANIIGNDHVSFKKLLLESNKF